MVLKLVKQFHMFTFTSSQGEQEILRKMMKYLMRYVSYFHQSCCTVVDMSSNKAYPFPFL
jgi:hypothetical protein